PAGNIAATEQAAKPVQRWMKQSKARQHQQNNAQCRDPMIDASETTVSADLQRIRRNNLVTLCGIDIFASHHASLPLSVRLAASTSARASRSSCSETRLARA